jgi:hypothetical protein
MKWQKVVIFTILVILLASCNLYKQPEKSISTATPALLPTSIEVETKTPSLSPTNIPDVIATSQLPPGKGPSTTLQDMPIVYYYFVAVASKSAPAGSITILPNELILGPTLSEIARSPDPVTNIRSALGAMLKDSRNPWTSTDIGIINITLKDGAANVELEGVYSAPGDIVLIAARQQIILTVFAEEAVQTAVITLNGENIVNLGISTSSEAKPNDYVITRAEVQAFLAENAHSNPR